MTISNDTNTPQSNVIWTSSDASEATGGRTNKDWQAYGISIDSRSIQPGDLFIAIKGPHFDGHDFIQEVFEKGAAAAVVSNASDELKEKYALLVVPDTMEALQDLGRAARHRTGAKVIGVTGSVGKTGTKEMLAAAFGDLGDAHASVGSYNNHWGVPYSLASMHAGTDYGVFEMGMSNAGEITPLSKMVAPHLAIITTVAAAHSENFNSMQGIADAKAEIFDGMDPTGVAVLNHDNKWFMRLKDKAEKKGITVYSFGSHADAHARVLDTLEAGNGSRCHADIMGQEISFTLLIPGEHIVRNALAVLLAVKLMEGDVEKAARALSQIEPIKGRGAREFLDVGDDSNPVTLIDESYNASPIAMKAAFKVLALIDPGRGGRRIAVLGDMRELGASGPRMHSELALPLKAAGVNLVYTAGPLMKNLYNSLPKEQRGKHAKSSKELAKIVPEVLTPGDVVLVKGSNGSKMDTVVEALRALPEQLKKQAEESEENAL